MGVHNLAPKHVGRKEYLMEMPAIFKGESLTRLAQGALVGAVATMIVGFYWGGWVLGSKAENNAAMPTSRKAASRHLQARHRRI